MVANAQVKLFDIRAMKELQSFRHKKEVNGRRYVTPSDCSRVVVSWHPVFETLFASGSADGALMYWMVG